MRGQIETLKLESWREGLVVVGWGFRSCVSSTAKYPIALDIRHAWLKAFQDKFILQPSRALEVYCVDEFSPQC